MEFKKNKTIPTILSIIFILSTYGCTSKSIVWPDTTDSYILVMEYNGEFIPIFNGDQLIIIPKEKVKNESIGETLTRTECSKNTATLNFLSKDLYSHIDELLKEDNNTESDSLLKDCGKGFVEVKMEIIPPLKSYTKNGVKFVIQGKHTGKRRIISRVFTIEQWNKIKYHNHETIRRHIENNS